MSKIPDTPKTKYNNNDAFRWVDMQWERFMTEQKELKARIKELEEQLENLVSRVPSSYLINSNERTDDWKIEQFNRNRSVGDQVSTIGEMKKAVEKLFSESTEYIYESPDGGETTYRRKVGDYDNKVQVDTDGNPLPIQMNLFK